MADIEMVAHEMQERIASDKFTCAVDGMPMAQRLFLVDKLQPPGMWPCHLRIGLLVTGAHDQADGVDAGRHNLVQQDVEHRLLDAIAVDQDLQGQGTLPAAGRGDYCLGYRHVNGS